MKLYLFLIGFLIIPFYFFAQEKSFFLSYGNGLGGSFFSSTYPEFTPLPGNRNYSKKKFIGQTQDIILGFRTKNNWTLRIGLNYQSFSKKVSFTDTLAGSTIVSINHSIRDRNFMYCTAVGKEIVKRKHRYSFGLGIYYLESYLHKIEVYSSRLVDNENPWKGIKNGEAGLLSEAAYEYQFQPKVSIGVKGQFYYTATAVYAESITLFPYISVRF
ncbi:hypothetical protein ESA94_20865 [Lacibacter luteus]|uniref:Outer membrane protein beta-barrel domain-containing protein n=1 Tax=Lacibacter luteus TaxID=2508719 RepID=A0A4Q1CD91_9BACT|nr:hypothetical protein [Lacibacter luteus]RXK57505.1 hypothetical protein ESA94_20865 [Lacibacter luteus]